MVIQNRPARLGSDFVLDIFVFGLSVCTVFRRFTGKNFNCYVRGAIRRARL